MLSRLDELLERSNIISSTFQKAYRLMALKSSLATAFCLFPIVCKWFASNCQIISLYDLCVLIASGSRHGGQTLIVERPHWLLSCHKTLSYSFCLTNIFLRSDAYSQFEIRRIFSLSYTSYAGKNCS